MRREEIHGLLDLVLDVGQKLVTRPEVPESRQHFRNARREALLGVRAMVEAAIARMDDEPATEGTSPTTIRIDEE